MEKDFIIEGPEAQPSPKHSVNIFEVPKQVPNMASNWNTHKQCQRGKYLHAGNYTHEPILHFGGNLKQLLRSTSSGIHKMSSTRDISYSRAKHKSTTKVGALYETQTGNRHELWSTCNIEKHCNTNTWTCTARSLPKAQKTSEKKGYISIPLMAIHATTRKISVILPTDNKGRLGNTWWAIRVIQRTQPRFVEQRARTSLPMST